MEIFKSAEAALYFSACESLIVRALYRSIVLVHGDVLFADSSSAFDRIFFKADLYKKYRRNPRVVELY